MRYDFYDFGNVQLFLWKPDDGDSDPAQKVPPREPARIPNVPRRPRGHVTPTEFSIRFRYPQVFESRN